MRMKLFCREDGLNKLCNVPSGSSCDKNCDESYSLEDGLDKPSEMNWEEEQCQLDREKPVFKEI